MLKQHSSGKQILVCGFVVLMGKKKSRTTKEKKKIMKDIGFSQCWEKTFDEIEQFKPSVFWIETQ